MKRSPSFGLYGQLKKKRRFQVQQASSSSEQTEHKEEDASGGVNETQAALIYLHSLVIPAKFDFRFPPIVFTHQLYNVVGDRTCVDQQLNILREKKEIKLFNLDKEKNSIGVVYTKDYKEYLHKNTRCPHHLIEKFISTVVDGTTDLTFNKRIMMEEFHFRDADILQLFHGGILTSRDVGSWWLAIPGAGLFLKTFRKGREALLRAIKTCKYKEILQRELEERKLKGVDKLGMKYHLHDILGGGLVTKIQTTSGLLLRYDG